MSGLDLDIEEFEAMAKDDRKAFERLFRKYYKLLCTYAVGIVKDKELAEDVVQEIFI